MARVVCVCGGGGGGVGELQFDASLRLFFR